jgi:hypothetical protein
LASPYGRTTLLLFAVVLELVAYSYVRSHSWDQSVLVVTLLAAGSPLLIALLLLAQRRFRLSTVLLSLAFFCVFLALIIVPIRRERNLRFAAHRFEEIGVRVSSTTSLGRSTQVTVVDQRSPDWLQRIAFVSSKLQDSEIQQITFETNEQVLASIDDLNRCKNLREVFVMNPIANSTLQRLIEELRFLEIKSFGAGTSSTGQSLDLSAFNDSSLEHLSLVHYNALPLIAELNLPNISSIFVGGFSAIGNAAEWKHCLSSATLARVKTLSFQNCKLGDIETAELQRLQNLVTLAIQMDKSLADLSFVSQLENLENLRLVDVGIDDESLKQLESATQLKTLYLGMQKSRFADDALNSLKQSLPNCEIRILIQSRLEILK